MIEIPYPDDLLNGDIEDCDLEDAEQIREDFESLMLDHQREK